MEQNTKQVTIYAAVHKADGRAYVGQTACPLEDRKRQHIYQSRCKKKSRSPFLRALDEEGEDAFDWMVLQRVSLAEADDAEVSWIDRLGKTPSSIYNVQRRVKRVVMTQERKERIAERLRGIPFDEERKAKISASMKAHFAAKRAACGVKR